jgi:aminoglycoside phosphotransferase (APT) family kinase protein
VYGLPDGLADWRARRLRFKEIAEAREEIHLAGAGDAAMIAELRRVGLIPVGVEPEFAALTGGVASDIWLVRTGERLFVVKRALAKLRVAADWRAPVSRNASEVEWLREAAAACPGAAPEVLAHAPELGFFAMSFLEPDTHPVWKRELQAGRADPTFAAKVGAALAAIHASTAGREEIASRVNDDALFRAIRVEPYLEFTAARHADLAPALLALAKATLARHIALVHGDVSPKNILVGPNGPVFLDAECAWYGDPAFDLAFCLNHLLMKCLWTPEASSRFLACFDALSGAYLARVVWEPPDALAARAAALLPALTLARIDGKSPVEYVTDEGVKTGVRRFTAPLILAPASAPADIRALWATALPTILS